MIDISRGVERQARVEYRVVLLQLTGEIEELGMGGLPQSKLTSTLPRLVSLSITVLPRSCQCIVQVLVVVCVLLWQNPEYGIALMQALKGSPNHTAYDVVSSLTGITTPH